MIDNLENRPKSHIHFCIIKSYAGSSNGLQVRKTK